MPSYLAWVLQRRSARVGIDPPVWGTYIELGGLFSAFIECCIVILLYERLVPARLLFLIDKPTKLGNTYVSLITYKHLYVW